MTGAKTTRRRSAPPSQPAEEKDTQPSEEPQPEAEKSFQFEAYAGVWPRRDGLFVTVETKGRITVSTEASRVFGTPEAVEMLYDRHKNVMAIRPASMKTRYALKTSPRKSHLAPATGCFVISGTGFCRYFGIPTTTSRRFRVEVFDGMLIADLNKPLE